MYWEELPYKIDVDKIQETWKATRLKSALKKTRRGLNTTEGEQIQWTDTAPTLQTALQYSQYSENKYLDPCRIAIKDTDFKDILDFYKDTYFEELIQEFSLVRTRLCLLQPKSTYSIHNDPTWRIQIPVLTNKDNYFIWFGDKIEVKHLELGKAYKVNTTINHTFANFSDEERIHLLGVQDGTTC